MRNDEKYKRALMGDEAEENIFWPSIFALAIVILALWKAGEIIYSIFK